MRISVLYVFFFLFSGSLLKSQTLTNQDVYNYNVGDIMQVRRTYNVMTSGWMCSDSLSTLTVLTKSISVGLDSITYQMHVESFLKVCNTPTSMTTPPYSYGYHNKTFTVTYTNLTQQAQHKLFYSTCTTNIPAVKDSLKLDHCNNMRWTRYYNNCGGTYTPSDKSYFIKNLGGPYYFHAELDIPDNLKFDLIYYKRITDSCGTFVVGYNPGVGLQEINPYAQTNISLYPNPSSDKVYINSEIEIRHYEIFDLLGKNIKSGKVNSGAIELSGIPLGIYNIRLYSSPGYVITKKIIVKD